MKQFLPFFFFSFLISTVSAQELVSSTYIESRSLEQMQEDFGIFMAWPVDLYKVTYTTPDIQGVQDTASGLVAVPVGPDRSFPIMLTQHGTVGSREEVPSNLRGGYELAVVYAGMGYISAAPDYLGLGDSRGFHPYVHADSEASASIDMLFALREQSIIEGFSINEQLFIMGYSQGGHAAAAAHREIQENYSADFNLVASAPMAGPYSISGEMRKAILSDEEYFFPAYLQYTNLSYNEVYGLYDDAEEFFKQPYADMMDQFYNEEITLGELNNRLIDELQTEFGASITKFMLQDSILTSIAEDENHPVNVALRDNDVYDWVPEVPTRFYYCMADDQVAFENSVFVDSIMNANGAADVMAVDIDSALDHGQCVEPAIIASIFFFGPYQEIGFILNTNEVDQETVKSFPNPTNDYLNLVDVEPGAAIELLDYSGKSYLRQIATTFNPSIAVHTVPSGLYVLKIVTEERTYLNKVVIE